MINMPKAQVEHPRTTDVDLSSSAFWDLPHFEREKSFAKLRKEAPVSFHPPVEVPFEHNEKGFWAVTRAKDITEVARDSETFVSGMGITLEALPAELAQSLLFFHGMDGAEHQKYRALVSAAFTPKQVGKVIGQIQDNAVKIVDDLVGAGDIDFVTACAEKLPLMTGASLFGVPESQREVFSKAASGSVARGDSDLGDPSDSLRGMREGRDILYQLGADLAAHRRKHPADDLMTNLVQAEIDGNRLSDDHIGAFTVLMAIASSDTTKQTTSHTAVSLDRFPEQKAWLMEDLEGRLANAANEFVRHASPVIHHARTATSDINFNGMEIAKGDKVVMFYSSGNRDESVFEDPWSMDLSRSPNPHVGFGGGGVHFCLGSRVALSQLTALFGQILSRIPNMEVGRPAYLRSTAINGIKRLPVTIK